MKKAIFLTSIAFLLVGCQNNNFDKTDNYELVINENSCMNCYKKIYEFDDGTKVYSSCTEITYKTENGEISLYDALEQNLLTASDLEKEQIFKIFKPNMDTNYAICNE